MASPLPVDHCLKFISNLESSQMTGTSQEATKSNLLAAAAAEEAPDVIKAVRPDVTAVSLEGEEEEEEEAS